VDLWEQGEKVLVFAFYRQTCRALRIHISKEIDRRSYALARRRLADAGQTGVGDEAIDELVAKVQRSYFNDVKTTGRQALDEELSRLVNAKLAENRSEAIPAFIIENLVDIMRRFLRVWTTLVRAFPVNQHEDISPERAVQLMLDHVDGSQVSWREKFGNFIDFFVHRCSSAEREGFLDATSRTTTGAIYVKIDGLSATSSSDERDELTKTLANVQEATGQTAADM